MGDGRKSFAKNVISLTPHHTIIIFFPQLNLILTLSSQTIKFSHLSLYFKVHEGENILKVSHFCSKKVMDNKYYSMQ
jgi:hypothetical protein